MVLTVKQISPQAKSEHWPIYFDMCLVAKSIEQVIMNGLRSPHAKQAEYIQTASISSII